MLPQNDHTANVSSLAGNMYRWCHTPLGYTMLYTAKYHHRKMNPTRNSEVPLYGNLWSWFSYISGNTKSSTPFMLCYTWYCVNVSPTVCGCVLRPHTNPTGLWKGLQPNNRAPCIHFMLHVHSLHKHCMYQYETSKFRSFLLLSMLHPVLFD